MRRFTPLAVVLLVAACSLEQEPSVSPPPPTSTTAPTTTTTSSADTTATTTSVAEAACPEGDVMLADGRLLGFDRPDSDGTRIAGITWQSTGQCQVLTVTFATDDGAPATTPPSIDARLLRNAGVLRIDTASTGSVVVDQLVEEGSVERLFVPVDEDDFRFIDLVLSEPAVARARVLTSPARLEIELEPGGPDVGRPLISPRVVLVEPGSAAVAESVLDIAGYSTGEIESLDLAVLRNDEEVDETTLELEPNPTMWREFRFAFQVGENYDTLRVTNEDGSVIAAIPLSPETPAATSP